MHIGDLIKELRKENNLTMKEVAKRLGVSRAYVSMLERNKNSATGKPIAPSMDTFKAVANMLNISIDDLLAQLDGNQKIYINNAPSKGVKIPKGTQLKRVPLLGYAAAGEPLEDLNQDSYYIDIDNKYDVDFCIQVRGDSMVGADINDGDIVVAIFFDKI